MARFHFHILSEGERITDEEGIELAGEAQARAEALAGARSIMAADMLTGSVPMNQVIEVLNSEGALLFAIPFSEAVEFRC